MTLHFLNTLDLCTFKTNLKITLHSVFPKTAQLNSVSCFNFTLRYCEILRQTLEYISVNKASGSLMSTSAVIVCSSIPSESALESS